MPEPNDNREEEGDSEEEQHFPRRLHPSPGSLPLPATGGRGMHVLETVVSRPMQGEKGKGPYHAVHHSLSRKREASP